MKATLHFVHPPEGSDAHCDWCERPIVLGTRWRTAAMSCCSFSNACLAHVHRLIGNPGVVKEKP